MIYHGFSEGMQKIWKEDRDSQMHYLSILARDVRGLPVEALLNFHAFFVPNSDYISLYFGEECRDMTYELYDYDGHCYLNNCIVFPCYTLLNNVVGWVSFNPFVRLKAYEDSNSDDPNIRNSAWNVPWYDYPSKRIFRKNLYLFVLPEIYKRALEEGYIILTDGVYDTVSLVHNGFNAASLLGSYISKEIVFLLSFIPNIFISEDNDKAGRGMVSRIRNYFPSARVIRQAFGKDSDEVLTNIHRNKFVEAISKGIKNNENIIFRENFYL